MEKIQVYGKEKCPQCDMTERLLGKMAIAYDKYNLAEMPEKIEEFKGRGLMQAPIVITEDDEWAGFRPDKIKGLSNG